VALLLTTWSYPVKVTNNNDVSLALAVWLLHDEYDYVNEKNYISVTTLMKPLRQIILPPRIQQGQHEVPDVMDYASRALGNSMHAAIERAWTVGHKRSLELLGYPENVIDRVRINPPDAVVLACKAEGKLIIPIYLEQRALRPLDGYVIGGKFDMVAEGIVQDYKSTSAHKWNKFSSDSDYKLQGSLYRWLNQDKITEDFVRINFIFTDWKKLDSIKDPTYPKHRIMHRDIPLLSIEETEAWARRKLALIKKYWNTPEKEIPRCTDEELWIGKSVFKYYSDPTSTSGKSTKNFTTLREANQFRAEKGKGLVISVPGSPKRCGYCNAFPICTQREQI
jgi:hypothetical protein